ncbi:MAG: hypothetical protein M3N45_05320, partial [Actinomycetota bacterium]|nr:hypothetical protein [Actinomycetota bacterium]
MQSPNAGRRLPQRKVGDILLSKGKITEEQLEEVLEVPRLSPSPAPIPAPASDVPSVSPAPRSPAGVGDLDCSDFATEAQAQAVLDAN